MDSDNQWEQEKARVQGAIAVLSRKPYYKTLEAEKDALLGKFIDD